MAKTLKLVLPDFVDVHEIAEAIAEELGHLWHTEKANEDGLEFYNYGHGTSGAGPRFSISSKVDKGYLTTTIDISDGYVHHDLLVV